MTMRTNEELLRQWNEQLAEITQLSLEEVAYAALVEHAGVEREKVASLEVNLMDGTLYVDAVILLESPLMQLTVTMTGVTDDDAEEDEAVGEAG
jgi:hypothetical protein